MNKYLLIQTHNENKSVIGSYNNHYSAITMKKMYENSGNESRTYSVEEVIVE